MKRVKFVKCFYTACSFSAILAILEGLAVKFLGLDYSNHYRRCAKYLELKEKTKTKPLDRRKTIKEDINKPRRSMDGQVTRNGED